jgi:hypothetical protein
VTASSCVDCVINRRSDRWLCWSSDAVVNTAAYPLRTHCHRPLRRANDPRPTTRGQAPLRPIPLAERRRASTSYCHFQQGRGHIQPKECTTDTPLCESQTNRKSNTRSVGCKLLVPVRRWVRLDAYASTPCALPRRFDSELRLIAARAVRSATKVARYRLPHRWTNYLPLPIGADLP